MSSRGQEMKSKTKKLYFILNPNYLIDNACIQKLILESDTESTIKKCLFSYALHFNFVGCFYISVTVSSTDVNIEYIFSN